MIITSILTILYQFLKIKTNLAILTILIPENKNQPAISHYSGNNFVIQRLMLFLKYNVVLSPY